MEEKLGKQKLAMNEEIIDNILESNETSNHKEIINMIVNESMTEAKLEGEALDAILAQIDRPVTIQ
jgi:hypothetical protein